MRKPWISGNRFVCHYYFYICTHDRKILVDITGQSEADLQKSQQIARLAVTKSVLLAGDAENALLADSI